MQSKVLLARRSDMNEGKICVPICSATGDEMLRRVAQAAPLADLIELRLDCLPVSDIDTLLRALPKLEIQYLITFRPRGEGGHSDATRSERMEFWSNVTDKLGDHDIFVDHEGDLDPPAHLDASRIVVSLHDFDKRISDLERDFEALARSRAHTIKIAIRADDAADGVDVWKLLERGRTLNKSVVPIAMGDAGKWTRILGLAHGAPFTYASLEPEVETAPGQISAADARDVFRVKELDRETKVFGVIAGDTSYSLSPYMHNAAFKYAAMNSVFMPLQTTDLDAFIRRMVRRDTRDVELNFRGFSVTNPHKQTIMRHLDEIDGTAREIGAVNTVKIEDEKLVGYNTDVDGFTHPLRREFSDLRDARVAVAGAGGASRACVFALTRDGADVTVLARDPQKATKFADEFGVTIESLTADSRRLTAFDILVNATPLGTRGPTENESIATRDELRGVKLVYDLVYNPVETRLLSEAKAAGAKTLGGLDMLIAQGARQFEIWTGREAPITRMRTAVEERLT